MWGANEEIRVKGKLPRDCTEAGSNLTCNDCKSSHQELRDDLIHEHQYIRYIKSMCYRCMHEVASLYLHEIQTLSPNGRRIHGAQGHMEELLDQSQRLAITDLNIEKQTCSEVKER